jgi:type I restriction enzyme, S subunit
MGGESPVPYPTEWPVARLGELALKIGSGATPKGGEEAYLPQRSKYALVRSQNVFDRRFETSGLAFISDEQAARLKGVLLRRNDLLLNITGDGITFGRSCRIPDEILPACVNQHVAIVRVNSELADPGYVLAYLTHPRTKAYIEAFNAGGSRRAITKGHIESFQLALPPLSEQRAISQILGTLDDKIDLNRRTNETLEAMARALFKSWFVDFDPVRAKAEGRGPGLPKRLADLFPDSFEESELGRIPASWRVTELGELCWRVAMGPFGSNIRAENFISEGVPVIRGGNLTDGLRDEDFVFISEEKADGLRSANAFEEDIVITHRGTLGQVGLIPKGARYPRYVVSQSQMVLTVNRSLATPHFLLHYLQSSEGQYQLLANTSQTGVPAIARPTTSLRAIRLVVSPVEVLRAFDSCLSHMADKIRSNFEQSRTLAALRDTLLPKLLSGELRIKDAERFVGRQI